MIWQLGNWLNVEGIVIRFAKKKKKKKTVLGILSKKVAKDDTENFDLRKRKDGVVPTIMGKIWKVGVLFWTTWVWDDGYTPT